MVLVTQMLMYMTGGEEGGKAGGKRGGGGGGGMGINSSDRTGNADIMNRPNLRVVYFIKFT